MKLYILLSFLALFPILWIVSIVILKKWKHVLKYSVLNVVFTLTYFIVIFYCMNDYFINDSYGLERIIYFVVLFIIQSLTSFIFALYYKYKLSNNVNQQRNTL